MVGDRITVCMPTNSGTPTLFPRPTIQSQGDSLTGLTSKMAGCKEYPNPLVYGFVYPTVGSLG